LRAFDRYAGQLLEVLGSPPAIFLHVPFHLGAVDAFACKALSNGCH
jgi:hypothetical protein